jgi:flagellin-like protein
LPSFPNHRRGEAESRFIRSRRGVSPVIATTIIIAITVTLGLGLWAYANSGVSSATQSYAESVKQYGDFTKDKFVIANTDFDTVNNRIILWIFNSGSQATNICNYLDDPTRCQDNPPIVVIARGTGPLTPTCFFKHDPPDSTFDCTASPDFTISPGGLAKFSFSVGTITPGTTYDIKVFSSTSASASDLKCYPEAGKTACDT